MDGNGWIINNYVFLTHLIFKFFSKKKPKIHNTIQLIPSKDLRYNFNSQNNAGTQHQIPFHKLICIDKHYCYKSNVYR